MNYNKYKKIINETLCTKTMDYSRLLNIPNYVLQLILYISKFYPSRETSKELNYFFTTLPTHYKLNLRNIGNTCWISSSIWFISSLTLLGHCLSTTNKELNPMLKFFKMYLTQNYDINKRPTLTNITSTCLINTKSYRKGEMDDARKNIVDFIDILPIEFKDGLFCGYSSTIDKTIIGLRSSVKSKEALLGYYENKLNKYLVPFSSNKKVYLLLDKNKYEYIDENFYVNLSGILKINPSIKNLQKLNDISYDHDLNKFIQANRYYRELIDVGNINKFENELIFRINSSENRSIKDYFQTIFVPEKLDPYESKMFKIVRSKIFKFEFSKPYLLIDINYTNKTKYSINYNKNFKLENSIDIGGNTFVLTAIAVKKGPINTGHWICYTLDNENNRFVIYDDLNHISYIEYKNFKFNESTYPAVLSYTNMNYTSLPENKKVDVGNIIKKYVSLT